jgi:rare lipoprotein A
MRKNRLVFSLALFFISSLGAVARQDRRPAFTSWYGVPYHGRLAANMERFDMYEPTVAHRTLPFGTVLEITNDAVSRSIIARVTDRGPFVPGRDLDISYGCAYLLGTVKPGVAWLTIREIENEEVSWAILKMKQQQDLLTMIRWQDTTLALRTALVAGSSSTMTRLERNIVTAFLLTYLMRPW